MGPEARYTIGKLRTYKKDPYTLGVFLYIKYIDTNPHSKIIFSFWSYSSYTHNAGGRVIKTIGLRNLQYCTMPFVAAVAFVNYQNIHLLLNDYAVSSRGG